MIKEINYWFNSYERWNPSRSELDTELIDIVIHFKPESISICDLNHNSNSIKKWTNQGCDRLRNIYYIILWSY